MMRPLFVLFCQTTICLATADAAEPGRAAEPVAPPQVIWYDGICSTVNLTGAGGLDTGEAMGRTQK